MVHVHPIAAVEVEAALFQLGFQLVAIDKWRRDNTITIILGVCQLTGPTWIRAYEGLRTLE